MSNHAARPARTTNPTGDDRRAEAGARIAVVIGTRAQLIKVAPVMRLMQEARIPYRFIYTAQHRETLDEIREDFRLKPPDYVLLNWSDEASTLGRFGGWFLRAFWRLVRQRRDILPSRGGIVITHGDTASTVWGALLGRLTGNRVMHLESGLRSRSLLQPFPEEIIRRITFRLSDVYACPNDWAVRNLRRFRGVKLNTKANTLYDAVAAALAEPGSSEAVELPDEPYAVVSIHRFENVFSRRRLRRVVDILEKVAASVRLLLILHPVTVKRLERYGLLGRLENHPRIELRPRLGFFAFQNLTHAAQFVMTDGGSNQEELSYLGKPTLILRERTERIEGLEANAVLCGLDERAVLEFVENYQKYATAPPRVEAAPSQIVVDWLVENGYADA